MKRAPCIVFLFLLVLLSTVIIIIISSSSRRNVAVVVAGFVAVIARSLGRTLFLVLLFGFGRCAARHWKCRRHVGARANS